jgi:hypothetical protein
MAFIYTTCAVTAFENHKVRENKLVGRKAIYTVNIQITKKYISVPG